MHRLDNVPNGGGLISGVGLGLGVEVVGIDN